jgi:hypothetical protein
MSMIPPSNMACKCEDSDKSGESVIHAADLDMTIAEVRRRWPQAVERVGLDGEPVWLREELADSVSVEDGEGRP